MERRSGVVEDLLGLRQGERNDELDLSLETAKYVLGMQRAPYFWKLSQLKFVISLSLGLGRLGHRYDLQIINWVEVVLVKGYVLSILINAQVFTLLMELGQAISVLFV